MYPSLLTTHLSEFNMQQNLSLSESADHANVLLTAMYDHG